MPSPYTFDDESFPDGKQMFLLANGGGRGLVVELIDALVRVREKTLLPWRCRGWHVAELAPVTDENALAVRCVLSKNGRKHNLQWRLHSLFVRPEPLVCLSLESAKAELHLFVKPCDYFAQTSPVGHLVACLDFLEVPEADEFLARELSKD